MTTAEYVAKLIKESKQKFAAVTEQYVEINKKLDSVIDTVKQIDQKVENTNIRMAGVEIELTEVKRVVDATFEAVGNHEERITVLEEKVR